MDAFPGYVGVIDSQYVYRHVNQRLADLMGASPAQIIGRPAPRTARRAALRQIAAEIDIAARGPHPVSTRSYRRPRCARASTAR